MNIKSNISLSYQLIEELISDNKFWISLIHGYSKKHELKNDMLDVNEIFHNFIYSALKLQGKQADSYEEIKPKLVVLLRRRVSEVSREVALFYKWKTDEIIDHYFEFIPKRKYNIFSFDSPKTKVNYNAPTLLNFNIRNQYFRVAKGHKQAILLVKNSFGHEGFTKKIKI